MRIENETARAIRTAISDGRYAATSDTMASHTVMSRLAARPSHGLTAVVAYIQQLRQSEKIDAYREDKLLSLWT